MLKLKSIAALFILVQDFSGEALATTKYDGRWELDATSNCIAMPTASFVIVIRSNRLTIVQDNKTKGTVVFGLVRQNGKVDGEATRQEHKAVGYGTLQNDYGQGKWKSDNCAGSWSAKKLGQ